MKTRINSLPTDIRGFERIIRLWHNSQLRRDGLLEVDMSGVEWMDANMCAPFGAVLYSFKAKGIIRLSGMRIGLRKALSVNGFLANFGFDVPRESDLEGTTIEYQRFERGKSDAFKDYIDMHFVGKGIPRMSEALHKKFRESIAEIYENANDHSSSSLGIFACGQHFPNENRLKFSIADLGIGMKQNIFDKMGFDLPAKEAIKWAIEKNNTTRQPAEGKPGGLGLKLIREFIGFNGGKIQIVSDRGYWCYQNSKESLRTLNNSFPGTVVNIEINTADTKSYRLLSEVDPRSIF